MNYSITSSDTQASLEVAGDLWHYILLALLKKNSLFEDLQLSHEGTSLLIAIENFAREPDLNYESWFQLLDLSLGFFIRKIGILMPHRVAEVIND